MGGQKKGENNPITRDVPRLYKEDKQSPEERKEKGTL